MRSTSRKYFSITCRSRPIGADARLLRLTREIFAQAAFRSVPRARDPARQRRADRRPGSMPSSAACARAAYHPSCSCRMGSVDDPMAVVDPHTASSASRRWGGGLLDHALDHQRQPECADHHAGEKAADHILGKPLLPPADVPYYHGPGNGKRRSASFAGRRCVCGVACRTFPVDCRGWSVNAIEPPVQGSACTGRHEWQRARRVESGKAAPPRRERSGTQGANFAVFSAHATKVVICLFDRNGDTKLERIALPEYPIDLAMAICRTSIPADVSACAYTVRTSPVPVHRFLPQQAAVEPYARRSHRRCNGSCLLWLQHRCRRR